MWHIDFADPGVIVYENVSFGFNISDGLTVVEHCFVRRVSIRSTVNDFPHFWTGYCVFEKVFPTFCLGIVDSLGSFTASVNSLLSILMDHSAKSISSAVLGSHVWSHPRFRLLTGFIFSNIFHVIEARNSKR